MRVLLVENQISPIRALATFFKAEGLIVECTDTGEEALELLRHYPFDLIVLNRAPTDINGTSLISRVRTAGHHTPIIALLGATSPKQRLATLSSGADDVVEHDIDRAELLARMRAILRRSRGYSESVIRCGKLALDHERQDVTLDGEHVHLTQKEFALLQLLMMRKNTVMTKEVILSNLYGGMDEPEIKIIDVFVCKIRSKLAKAGVRNLIQTEWGRGYVVRDISRDDDRTPEPCIPLPHRSGAARTRDCLSNWLSRHIRGDTEIPTYRLFPIAPDGRIADAPVILDAIHDVAALFHGERICDRTHEVWDGARRVGVVFGKPAHDYLADVREAFGASVVSAPMPC